MEFAQEALSQCTLPELVRIVRDSGKHVLHTVHDRTEDLFPLRKGETGESVFAYFWTYRLRCKQCDYMFLLIKRPWLSRKPGKHKALIVLSGEWQQSVKIGICGEVGEKLSKSGLAWPKWNSPLPEVQ